MKLIANSHRIYFIGGIEFLVVQKSTGIYPTQWNKTIIKADELYKIIFDYYGVENAFTNFFKNNKELELLFSLTNNFDDFFQKLPILKCSNILNVLNSCEIHDFTIEDYKKLEKSKKKFDVIFNYSSYKNYIFVAA